jgi:kynurenine formamidase
MNSPGSKLRLRILACAAALLSCEASAEALDLQGYRLVDLTHVYDKDTVFWPSGPERFELRQLHYGDTDGGFFYSANTFCTPEHGGTHLDAPIHFARGRQTAEQVPLQRLVGPVVVIDVSDKAAADRDYRVTPEDILDFEARHGRIESGMRVLVRTGWSRRWPDAAAYLGHATDATKLHFPSYGAEAARLLVEERKVALLGFPGPPHRRGSRRARSREPDRTASAAGARRHAHCAADEDRGRLGRADARRRPGAAGLGTRRRSGRSSCRRRCPWKPAAVPAGRE